jgi:acylphosphatase
MEDFSPRKLLCFREFLRYLPAMNRKTVHFSGNVQGVGFRYTTQHLATPFKVTGYVKNMPDGRVELVIEGDDDQLEGLMNAIQQRMGEYIRKSTVQVSAATGQFKDFTIRH